jgi:hypothetical protein
MAVQVQARGGGGITLGGNLNLAQIGVGSPAMWSAILFAVLMAVIVLVAVSLR